MTMPNIAEQQPQAPQQPNDAQSQLRELMAKLGGMMSGKAMPAAVPEPMPPITEDSAQQAAENDMRGGKTFEQFHGQMPAGNQRGLLKELLVRLSGGEMGR
jgi:hypothetical protein